jgi:hypothetical protein
LRGQEFEFVGYAHTWGERRVFFCREGDDRIASLPATWTSVEEEDPFVVVAAGRSLFRVGDLLGLVGIVEAMGAKKC